MMDLRKLDIEDLTEIYIVANTPAYLYKHFRKFPSIQSLASQSTEQELLAMYDTHASRKPRSLEDVVLAYAAVIALTWKDYPVAHEAIRNLDSHGLDWLDEVRKIFQSTTTILQIVNVDLTRAPSQDVISTATSTVPSLLIDVAGENG